MIPSRPFLAGFVAGVALCVAPAAFLLGHYSGASSWLAYLFYAGLSLVGPWLHAFRLL